MLPSVTCSTLRNCYFCAMFLQKKEIAKGYCLLLLLLLVSCNTFFGGTENKVALARVGESYLYEEDIAPFIAENMTPGDSTAFVINYINRWASKQLLLSKSQINLPEEKLADFDRLVEDYKTDLYTKAYLELLVQQSLDTMVSQQQLQQFYEDQKDNFKLDEKLVQLRFVVLPQPFLNQEEVKDKLRSFTTEDKVFLDSIAVQFKKLHFQDSVWVSASRVMQEIPPIDFSNQDAYLKKSQFFELQDSLGVYLGKVTNMLDVNDVAPLSFITPKIKQIILNRRRLRRMKRLETDIIDEAIQKNEFEVYEPEE